MESANTARNGFFRREIEAMIANSRRATYISAGIASSTLLGLLLALPYSFGVGSTSYGIGEYLWVSWTTNPDMQHGFLVLPAIAYLIYEKRLELAKIPLSGASLAGLFVLAVGLFLFWAGSQADVTSIGLASLMIVTVGLVWFFLGWKALMLLSFPIGFFIFAIPLPGIDLMIAFPLRMIMAKTAVFVLNLLGEHVIRQGTGILSAPDPLMGLLAGKKFSIDVADPCSGIRSLFALMMVSALYAHFTLKTWWEKWILFLCSIPLAIAGNLVRILALTLATVAFGSEFAIGKNPLTEPSWFHMGAGYAVFAVALGGMISIAWLLTNLRRIKSRFVSLIQALKNEALNPASVSNPPSAHPDEAEHLSSDTTPDSKTSPTVKLPHRPDSPY